ncbi:MAG: acyl-CoA synthetase [Betaproteobacteria bacterium]|nr:acyl-CoA synthetase [Rubrivivax sp.]
MSTTAPAGWAESRERSNRLALRLIAWIATRLGRPAARLVLVPVTLYFLLFAPGPRRHARRYLARALGRTPGWRDLWRHFHAFASVALDRIWFARGEMRHFDLRLTGGPVVDAALADGRGALMLGAHLGSFEVLHTVGAERPGMHVAMVMYPDNARMVQSVLQALAPEASLDVIPLGQPGSALRIRDWLDGGGLVGLLGDRFRPGAGLEGSVACPFLGPAARFGDGPLRLALTLRREVVFMVGLYHGGARYEVRFEPLADFRSPPAGAAEREQAVQQALAAYVQRLEQLCREAPYNWFNFYDFWHEDAPAPAAR